MDNSQNLTHEEILRRTIDTEQADRKRRKRIAWAVVLLLSIVPSPVMNSPIGYFLLSMAIYGFWAFILTSAVARKKDKQIRQMLREHSHETLRKLLESAFPGAVYHPGEFISPNTLTAPFEPSKSNRVSEGSDYIRGFCGEREFAVCEATLLRDSGEDETVLCNGIGLVILTGCTVPAAVARRAVRARKDQQTMEYVYENPDKALTDRLLPEEWLLRLYRLRNGNVHACLLPNGTLVLCMNSPDHLFTFPANAIRPDDMRASLENDIARLKTLLDTVMSNKELFGSNPQTSMQS